MNATKNAVTVNGLISLQVCVRYLHGQVRLGYVNNFAVVL